MLKQRNGERELLVWQWYWVGGRTTTDRLRAKAFEVISLLSGRGNPAASVLVYTPVSDVENLAQARARLQRQSEPLVRQLNITLDSVLDR